MQSGSAHFVRAFLTVTAVLLGGNALINSAVDPYGVYVGKPTKLFYETKADGGSRIAKAELARHFCGTTILVGSSRAEVGYDPESPAIPNGPVAAS